MGDRRPPRVAGAGVPDAGALGGACAPVSGHAGRPGADANRGPETPADRKSPFILMALLADYAITPVVFDLTSCPTEGECAARLETIREAMLTEGPVRDLRDVLGDGRPWHRRGRKISTCGAGSLSACCRRPRLGRDTRNEVQREFDPAARQDRLVDLFEVRT